MSWVKVDDRANEHRKQLAAGPVACWLWACSLMYCNRQKARDGFIPEAMLTLLYPIPNVKKHAARLVEVGLWEATEGGFRLHDYHDYQPSIEDVEAYKSARSEAGKLGGKRSGEARRKQADEANAKQTRSNLLQSNEANAKQTVEAKTNPSPDPSPVPREREREREALASEPPTPVPVIPAVQAGNDVTLPTPKLGKRMSVEGTVLPPDWYPSPELLDGLRRKEGIEPLGSLDDFKDYWAAATGPNAKKANWDAAFRLWVRRDKGNGKLRAWIEPSSRPTSSQPDDAPATPEQRQAFLADWAEQEKKLVGGM